jgi:hypothetical protein
MENAMVLMPFQLVQGTLYAFKLKFTYIGVPKSGLQGAMPRSS